MSSSKKPTEPRLAASGGIRTRVPRTEEPYRALDELMVVVESLGPRPAPRKCFDGTERMLL
jgi:hypothetical protein